MEYTISLNEEQGHTLRILLKDIRKSEDYLGLTIEESQLINMLLDVLNKN